MSDRRDDWACALLDIGTRQLLNKAKDVIYLLIERIGFWFMSTGKFWFMSTGKLGY